MKKVLTVFGTRPEAIKMAPLVHALADDPRFESRVCVTAQHREMLDQVLGLFEITPEYDLNLMKPGQTLSDVTSGILKGMESVLDDFQPDVVLVHGDTATTFATALAAYYKQIHVGHVEAGLRTGNIYSPWPEEGNRKLTGALTRYHFAPTETSKQNLLNENVPNSDISVTGNTVRRFAAEDAPAPEDAYGISKWEAEQGLQRIGSETGMEVVIIRPPLVYGPGVKGNFASMINLVAKGLPLPLGAIHNQRSLVALDNLVDLIITCIDHPAAANQVFLSGDGQDLSTTELLRGVAQAMGKPSRLIPVPSSLLMLGATLLGKKALAQRLLGSLQVDISKARELLGWSPPLSVEEGLRRCFQSEIK